MSSERVRWPSRPVGTALRRVWGSSIPLRVIASTLSATVILVLLGGQLFLTQTLRGIVAVKKQASIVEASTALQRMQNQLDDTDLRTESLLERLGQLADEVGSQPNQFSVIIETASSIYMSRGIMPGSVPQALRDELSADPSALYVTPTQVSYDDGSAEPGVAIGGHLVAPSGQMFPVYFVFPAQAESQTLQMLRQALWSTGGLLLVALALISFAVTRQITVPLRVARDVAGRIAAGDLDQRMQVRGTDEMASLAQSMNDMAGELQRKIGQLEDLSRVQQQFVSDVSHELRTPLTTMRMATEVLHDSREEFSPDLGRSVELLHDQEERFESMLTDLLEISRFDAGAAVLTLDEVDLADLVGVEVGAQRAMAASVETPIEVVTWGSTIVEVDARRIQRIVRNLLTNALCHADQRLITVTTAGDDHAVALTVRDRGVGFEPAQSEQVFRRFWRADASRTRVVGGTGLGLAISLEDAHLHHGWLEAWGSPGNGASFRLTLPRTQQIVLEHSPLPLVPSDAGAPEDAGSTDAVAAVPLPAVAGEVVAGVEMPIDMGGVPLPAVAGGVMIDDVMPAEAGADDTRGAEFASLTAPGAPLRPTPMRQDA